MDFSIFRFDKDDLIYDTAKIEYYLNDSKINSCAFEIDDSVSLHLILPRALGTTQATLEIFHQDKVNVYKQIPLLFEEIVEGKDIYIANLDNFAVGLYFCRICITTSQHTMFGYGSHREIYFSYESNRCSMRFYLA